MATLVLTAVGGVLGGPIGAAIGALTGNVFDNNVLFAPKRREGPRLSDLAVQTSSYGAPIAHLFGTMRVAGTVIWATDLIERRSEQGGGKGRPGTVTYSYSASFAVLLSARPILSVGRIWADGKLLRGAAGDWKARTGFRIYTGGEDQAADPLIVSAEGAALTPAHRGCAYAVFEELELADFGNRIPSLTFEVTADPGAVALGDLVSAIGDRSVAADDAGPALLGYSAYGGSRRGAIEPLVAAGGGWFASDGAAMRFREGVAGSVREVADAGAGTGGARRSRTIAPADAVPRSVALAHHDPARDYQAGLQRTTRPGAGSREMRIDLAAAIGAETARGWATAALARAETTRERRIVTTDWREIDVAPGDRVRIAGEPGVWRVAKAGIEGFVVRLELLRIAAAPLAGPASAGRVLGAPDRVAGGTVLAAFDLPPVEDAPAPGPRLAIAAAGTGSGWRSAGLTLSIDGGASWRDIGTTAAPAVVGTIATPPGSAEAVVEDRANTMVVALANDAMVLADADAAALDAGANLAMAGEELVQFGRAEPLGGGRWQLSTLWRGRRGTEAAIGTQLAGDRFVLIDRSALAVETITGLAPGTSIQVIAAGVADPPEGVAVETALIGRAAVPPAPVHLSAREIGDGGLIIDWVRRSRTGWRWQDAVDAPLGEESERYSVTVARSGGSVLAISTDVPSLVLSAEERGAGTITLSVRQVGTHGMSAAATHTIPAD